MPGGSIPIDEALADALIERVGLEPDQQAHLHEHAIEVQLPFLQALNPNLRIVPVVLGRLPVDACIELGEGMADVVGDRDDVLIAASTDMSHYVSAAEAKRLDTLAIERVLDLDPRGLHATVEGHDISMCGYIPTTVALAAAQETRGHRGGTGALWQLGGDQRGLRPGRGIRRLCDPLISGSPTL